MTSSSKRPKVKVPAEPAPPALPVPGREEDEAKKKVRARAKGGGRESTIFAGRLNRKLGALNKRGQGGMGTSLL